MHVGKIYPYSPYYWVTECWFWPNFCPWRLRVDLAASQPFPWNAIVTPFSGFTTIASPSNDMKECRYNLRLSTTAGFKIIQFNTFKEYFEGRYLARRQMTLTLDGTHSYRAIRRDDYDVANWNWSAWGECIDLITGLPIASPVGSYRYAKYDEVGSPFPDY